MSNAEFKPGDYVTINGNGLISTRAIVRHEVNSEKRAQWGHIAVEPIDDNRYGSVYWVEVKNCAKVD